MAPATTLLSTPPLVLGPLDAPTSSLRPCSRHRDDAEVQPVPGVPEEREVIDAETPGQHLNEGLKGVDPREGVPGKKRTGRGRVSHLGMCTHTTIVQRRRRDTKIADGYPGLGDLGEGERTPTPPCLEVLCRGDGVSPLKDESRVAQNTGVQTWDGECGEGHLLHILGPRRRVAHGHEHTVGQDGDHDKHAEQRRGGRVKERGAAAGKRKVSCPPLASPPVPLGQDMRG